MNQDRLRKSPNIALVGSTSLLGKELRQMLDDRGLPVGRLAVFETEEYAGLLQEFAGDIQITQVISPEALEDIDIAFFTCSPAIMQAYTASGAPFPLLPRPAPLAGPPRPRSPAGTRVLRERDGDVASRAGVTAARGI